MTVTTLTQTLLTQYIDIRKHTEKLCSHLEIEDYVIQPIEEVSPPKWHLGHTTWFFEQFFLQSFDEYKEFDPSFSFVFNSYYESVGQRVLRPDRGNMSRPTVAEVYAYRNYVDEWMEKYLSADGLTNEQKKNLLLGLHHEQQHQELLLTDIKYILGFNPLFPAYHDMAEGAMEDSDKIIHIPAGIYKIGYSGKGFCYDNEKDTHEVHINEFLIQSELVTNGEYMEFIYDGGYKDFRFWHSEGWQWIKDTHTIAPLYWHLIDGQWHYYTLRGLERVNPLLPVAHISYYEAAAFADWKAMRLPTEFEWEVAAPYFDWGQRWEWTNSAYLPYPGFRKASGALGEYNGKFMINQMVLRGSSIATPVGHSRITYRNFFHPNARWQYSGIRLVHK